jgi:hypothetical protein
LGAEQNFFPEEKNRPQLEKNKNPIGKLFFSNWEIKI